jgi:hypothetical protein
MSDEATYISLNAPNIITITICGLLGFGILAGSTILYNKMTGKAS